MMHNNLLNAFFHFEYHTLEDSYTEIQKHIELVFGKPHLTIKHSDISYDAGFDSCTWKYGRIKIRHYAFERFGSEEHFHIER